MATVTQSFIREMDVTSEYWPAGNLSAALASGVLISNSETRIPDNDPDYVEGKNRTRIVRVFRSLEDKQNFETEALANTARQAFATKYHVRKINEIIS